MKKIISIMLILASLAAFASCGNNNNGSDSTDTSTGDTSTADTSTTGDTTAADTTKADESASTTTVSAADIGKAVADEFGDDYIPDMDIPADYLDSTYGVKPEWYDDFFGQMPMINVNVDTFIAVKAKADKVSDVEKALNDYADYYKNDAQKYPKDLAKVDACRVYTKGNYVFFIMLGVTTDEVENMDDAAQVKFYTEQNDRAVKVIDSLLG